MNKVIWVLIVLRVVVASFVNGSISDVSLKAPNTYPVGKEEAPQSVTFLEEEILEIVFEVLKKFLKEGIPSIGVLPLDPFVIAEINLKGLTHPVVSGDLQLYNFSLKGISDFHLKREDINVIDDTLSMVIMFDSVVVSADYEMDLELFDIIDVFGAGNFSIDLKNLIFDAQFSVNFESGPWPIIKSVSNTIAKINISSTSAKITGLYKDECLNDWINKKLNEITFLRYYEATLTTLAHEVLCTSAEVINEEVLPFPKIQKPTFEQVWEVIQQISDKLWDERDSYKKTFGETFKRRF